MEEALGAAVPTAEMGHHAGAIGERARRVRPLAPMNARVPAPTVRHPVRPKTTIAPAPTKQL
jgi:hypothetical protein